MYLYYIICILLTVYIQQKWYHCPIWCRVGTSIVYTMVPMGWNEGTFIIIGCGMAIYIIYTQKYIYKKSIYYIHSIYTTEVAWPRLQGHGRAIAHFLCLSHVFLCLSCLCLPLCLFLPLWLCLPLCLSVSLCPLFPLCLSLCGSMYVSVLFFLIKIYFGITLSVSQSNAFV